MDKQQELEYIAKYNLANGTHFYTLEQVANHASQNSKPDKQSAFQRIGSALAQSEGRTATEKAILDGAAEATSKKMQEAGIDKETANQAAINPAYNTDKTTAALNATILTLLPDISAGVPGIIRLGTSALGGYAGNRVGKYFDDKLGTSFLKGIGSFAGGLAGYGFGNKVVPDIIDSAIIRKNLRTGKLEFVGPKTYSGVHQSDTYFETPTFPTERWDVVNHGADPNGFFLTLGEPAKRGFLAKRPYTLHFNVDSNKGLVQHGEINGAFGYKNRIRNNIVKYARKKGADVVHFDGIKDNTLPDQQILFATDKAGIKFKNVFKSSSNGNPVAINDKNLISDINAGKQDALDFLSSSVKKETDTHNKALAKRLGWEIVQTPERAGVPMKQVGKPYLNGVRIEDKNDGLYVVDTINGTDANGVSLIVPDNPIWDEIYITSKGNPRQTVFHEYLHRGDIGGSVNNKKLDTKAFFDWKSKKILNPDTYNNLTYLNQPGEAAANILEIGKKLNIPIGAKYPGKRGFYNIIENALSKNDPKLNLLQYYNWKNKPKRVWEGLTGKYFTLPILVAGGVYGAKD